VAADATFTWNGGTGLASDPANWTMTGVSQSNDDIVIGSGDAQFMNTLLPGPNNGTLGATVFFQGGTIDMVNSGTAGTAGILDNTLLLVSGTVRANATLTSAGGSTNNGTIDVGQNGTLTFSVLSGDATNAGIVEALNGGSLLIQGGNSGASFTNLGAVIADGGNITVTATLGADSGQWNIGDAGAGLGGSIELNTPVTSADAFDFLDAAGTLQLDQVTSFSGTLLQFGTGDTLGLGSSASVDVATIIVTPTGNANQETMTLENTGGGIITTLTQVPFGNLEFAPGTFAVDPASGVAGDFRFFISSGQQVMTGSPSTVACFAAGTRIAVEHGEVAIEALRVGDRVRTVVGRRPAPIVWIGHRSIDCSRHPRPRLVWPVRIAAGAFGRGRPSRDLFLSPEHAIYLDGVLIPVKHLIDGGRIAQAPRAMVTYYHIELPRHDVVLADGMTAESYLAGADPGAFARSGGPVALHPDLSSRVWEAEGCAPLVVTGPALAAARRRVRRPGRAAPVAAVVDASVAYARGSG